MLTRAQLADYAQLARRRFRDESGRLLVEGVRSVEAALDAGAAVEALLVTEDAAEVPRVAGLLARVPEGAVHRVPLRDLSRLATVDTAQGLVAVARHPPPGSLGGARRVLVLDGVQDPGNVGTLVRTAAWFGLDAVVAGPGTADPFSPKVVRGAMGGLWDVAVLRPEGLADVLDGWRAAGGQVVGATLGGTDASAWTPQGRVALVLGSEGHGLGPEASERLDAAVTIPGSPRRRGAESLNVGVAGGLLMWRMALTP